MSSTYLKLLQKSFREKGNKVYANKQAKYMKNRFVFYGLSAPERRKIQKAFLVKEYLPQKQEAYVIIKKLWLKPQRELHYFAQELAYKYQKQVERLDIELYEYLITQNSWWDTVDFIASNLVGNYFTNFPDEQELFLEKWMQSENIWLQRTCVIFQLKYKQDTNTKILYDCITQLIGSKEFFINKAIGWALREYGKTNPNWVINFVKNHTQLANLSKREALRLLN